MKKLFLLLIIISLFSCEKEEICPCPDNSDRLFIEQYNTLSGVVQRYLKPYDCNLTPEQNIQTEDCTQPNTGCRIVYRP